MKKRTWAEITARVNEIGECQREVIEVIKKWSDLKCDTKRKVAAMRSGTVPNRGLNSRLSRDLNQTEKIVLQILEMDEEDQSTGDFGPLGDDDDVPEEEEEMEEEDIIGMQSSPNGGLDMVSMPPPTSYSMSECKKTFCQYLLTISVKTSARFICLHVLSKVMSPSSQCCDNSHFALRM